MLKFHLCNRGYKSHTMQSATDEVDTNDRDTLLQCEEKTLTRVPLVTTYHPVLRNLNMILRNNLSILYTNERMADLLKDQPMAAFKRPRILKKHSSESEIRQPIAQLWH